ncbi:hypothetical protein CYMTET_56799 [Cymbomonas tetramitiformis]|uniref:Uncharacterized protein n=1 Tax=Cymbomonas tetramitiformis TaxID=36881 RepID=A0AAE0BBD6_9CHLO|nr:hypothetical protein CYMTET_56799 [Cymbomonas tetramitiformis]
MPTPAISMLSLDTLQDLQDIASNLTYRHINRVPSEYLQLGIRICRMLLTTSLPVTPPVRLRNVQVPEAMHALYASWFGIVFSKVGAAVVGAIVVGVAVGVDVVGDKLGEAVMGAMVLGAAVVGEPVTQCVGMVVSE